MGNEKTFQAQPEGNEFADLKESIGKPISQVASILSQIHAAQQKHRRKETRLMYTPEISLNFNAQSVYVDNSRGMTDAILTTDKNVTYLVPSTSRGWVHPLGESHFDFTGDAQCVCIFVDEFLPIS